MSKFNNKSFWDDTYPNLKIPFVEHEYGWDFILIPLFDYANEWNKTHLCQSIEILQIEEKYGSLRFYHNGGDDIFKGMVMFAEKISSNICKYCGNKGFIVGSIIPRTECPQCKINREGGWGKNKDE